MLVAFTLGLMGSLGHCVGMCSGITLLINRQGITSGWQMMLVHLGRITTYGTLGLIAGALSQTILTILSYCALPGTTSPTGGEHFGHTTLGTAFPALTGIQGLLAVLVAGMALYLALAMIGRVPSPEIYLVTLTTRWGRAIQHLTARPGGPHSAAFLLGLVWGLLPCGLILTALLTAAATGSPWRGALTMLAFGLGTWPALLGISWAARQKFPRTLPWSRHLAALVVLLFGTQMALRGLAVWGVVEHMHLGGVMVW